MENLIIEDLTDETIVDFIDCFKRNGSTKKAENLRWQFFENTVRKSIVDIAKAKDSGKTAAIYAVACVNLKIGEKLSIGGQSMDTITDLDYRGTGLFINLAKDVYEKAIPFVDLIYGFPNMHSVKGFKKLLQWQILDPVPFLVKPLRSRYFTSKIKALKFLPDVNLSPFGYYVSAKFKIEEHTDFPDEVNDLWKKFSGKFGVGINRDKAYLDWRFIQKPNENYKIAHCYKDGKYLGFVVYTVKTKHNGTIGYIMELIYDLNEKGASNALLAYAIAKIKNQKADCILSWCLEHSPNYSTFKKIKFFDLPEKFRPIELHFGVRSFRAQNDELVYDRSKWYLSYADSDTV